MYKNILMVMIAVGVGTASAQAGEVHISEAKTVNGMTIGAVYIQAVKMDMGQAMAGNPGAAGHDAMVHHMSHATSGDIHLEADVHAAADNDWGFPEGQWVPYLNIGYTLKKLDGTWSGEGTLLPMIAADGPHYGANIDLSGPGKYSVSYRIAPPAPTVFPRHFDKETGVAEWWAPFTAKWEFVYAGAGKKGGY